MENLGTLLSWLICAGLIVLFLAGWGGWLKDGRRYVQRKRLAKAQQRQKAVELQDRMPEILAKLEKDQDLTAIPKAFGLLFVGGDPAQKIRAARIVTQRVRRLPLTQLKRLDSLFRERTSSGWDFQRKRADISGLFLPSLSETEQTVLLGVASFHPNGYFREKAVRALSRRTDGAELPFLIIRLNDWVIVIWNRVHAAVLDRVRPQNARAIIDALPLIFRLGDRTRRRHHDLVDAFVAVLSRPEARPDLELGLRSRDSAIRRYCFQAIIETAIFDHSALIESLVKEPSPMNRAFILRQIRDRLTPEDIRPYRSKLLCDRSGQVRLTALRTLNRINAAESIPDLEQAVLDEDPAIRAAARCLLGRSEDNYDFPQIYRQVLLGRPAFCPGAIAGLGETGRADDTKYVIPFLKADTSRMVRVSMRAIARLDFAKAKDALIAFLDDVRPGVVKEARRLLFGRIDAADAEVIYRDHFHGKSDPLKRHAAFLLCGLGKWDALKYILEICADREDRVAAIGRAALSRWLMRYNGSFATPTQAQIKAAQRALEEYGSAVTEETRRLLEFVLKGFLSSEDGPHKLEWWTRPGVVDLRDLAKRYPKDPLAIARLLEAAKLAPQGPASASFAPPRVVMAIVPVDEVGLLARSRAWLEDAAHVIVLRDRNGSVADSDPCLEEAAAAEWKDALAAFSVPIELVDWRRDADVSAALERAVARSKVIAPAPPVAAPPPIVEHPPGPRVPVDCVATPFSIDRVIASHLVASEGRVTLFAGAGAVDLSDPTAVVFFDHDDAVGAVTPQGRRLVLEQVNRFRIDDQRFEAFGYVALGFDGHHPVGWTGFRMAPYWLYAGTHGVGFLSAIDHDYPCGPAKKLYGFADNDPVGVTLAPDLGAVAYRFEHDILVTSAIPIPWRTTGALRVADFPHDPSRALFFAQTPGYSRTDDLLDDDAREKAPGFVLGPSAEARYALDLSDIVYRITSVKPWAGAVARVGGPGEGFAVFNEAHQEVRRASGRLLDGWWRWATIIDDGAYWREDLATGERRRIAAADVPPIVAVGVPWTKNVVLLRKEGQRLSVQLI